MSWKRKRGEPAEVRDIDGGVSTGFPYGAGRNREPGSKTRPTGPGSSRAKSAETEHKAPRGLRAVRKEARCGSLCSRKTPDAAYRVSIRTITKIQGAAKRVPAADDAAATAVSDGARCVVHTATAMPAAKPGKNQSRPSAAHRGSTYTTASIGPRKYAGAAPGFGDLTLDRPFEGGFRSRRSASTSPANPHQPMRLGANRHVADSPIENAALFRTIHIAEKREP
jgi:hypothetical protein